MHVMPAYSKGLLVLLRDYKYIDVARIVDYLSSIDPGVVGELTQRMKSNSGVDLSGGINIQAFKLGGGARKGNETEIQQTVRIYAQHMFNRLYGELQNAGSIQTVDSNTPLEPFSKRMNLSEKRAISNQPKQNRTLRAGRVFKEGHPL